MQRDYLVTLLQYLTPLHGLSRFSGKIANIQVPWIKNYIIRRFIKKYGVNMSEASETNPTTYASFNDFFIRHLKQGARPLAKAPIVSPVDGYLSEMGAIEAGRLIQAKGKDYTLTELLGDSLEQTAPFINGQFATLYLSPKDYHRIHMPIQGRLIKTHYIPGELFSVQPATTRLIPRLFARNERVIAYFETELGLMAMVLVGAVIVGSIGTVWHGDFTRQKKPQVMYPENPIELKQGEEMGYFKLGSTVIVLFESGINLDRELVTGDEVRMGQRLGE
jgi:phosphatidylserine decarboxylase